VSDLSVAERPSISIDAAAIRLTDTILGYNEEDLAETLKAIASAIGVAHISYVRFAPDKSSDHQHVDRGGDLFKGLATPIFLQGIS
jgi:hypothetical protein